MIRDSYEVITGSSARRLMIEHGINQSDLRDALVKQLMLTGKCQYNAGDRTITLTIKHTSQLEAESKIPKNMSRALVFDFMSLPMTSQWDFMVRYGHTSEAVTAWTKDLRKNVFESIKEADGVLDFHWLFYYEHGAEIEAQRQRKARQI